MRKRVVVSIAATVHPSKPLASFLFRFSCSGEGGVFGWLGRSSIFSHPHPLSVGYRRLLGVGHWEAMIERTPLPHLDRLRNGN